MSLYGVKIGNVSLEKVCFKVSNASKAALISLAKKLEEEGFLFIDCQMHTNHLESMGRVCRVEQIQEMLKEGTKFN